MATYNLRNWARKSGVQFDTRYVCFWFEVWADPRWKGTTPLHDNFYKIPANASSFPSMSDQSPDDEFRTVRDTLMARHILHAWNLEQMERGAHSIFDRKDALPVGRANNPETTRCWRGPRDWIRGTGQSGLSESLLLVQHYNVREMFVPNWLARRCHFGLYIRCHEIIKEYLQQHVAWWNMYQCTGVPRCINSERPENSAMWAEHQSMAKISDDEARASYHTMALFPTLHPRYSHNQHTNEFNDWHNFEFNRMHRNVREEWQLRFGRGNGARDVELGRHQPGYALGELERSGVPPPDLTLHPPMQALGQWEWNDDFGLVQDIIDPNRFWAREEVAPELMPLPEDIPENFEGDEAS